MTHYPLLIPFLDLARHMIAAVLAIGFPRTS